MKIETKKFRKASEALQAARQLISDTKRWTRNYLAIRKEDGLKIVCSTKSKNAEAFCALGAVKHVNGPAERSAVSYLREAALRHLQSFGAEKESTTLAKNVHIFDVNDGQGKYRGHKNVMKIFVDAIRRAKKDGN
jgi:hypothetical protein